MSYPTGVSRGKSSAGEIPAAQDKETKAQCSVGSAGARAWVTATASPYLGPARGVPVLIHQRISQ